MAISVNMFRLRWTTDAQARSKNGHPPQSTTGVESASWIHTANLSETCGAEPPAIISPMVMSRTGVVRIALVQNRRFISASSGFSSCSRVTVFGSRAIPQMGHAPGPVRTISGCIGQVYVTSTAPTGAATDGTAGVATGACAIAGLSPVYFSGPALNFSRQCRLQKYHFFPPYSYEPAARAGSTVIPHTGSLVGWLTMAKGDWGCCGTEPKFLTGATT